MSDFVRCYVEVDPGTGATHFRRKLDGELLAIKSADGTSITRLAKGTPIFATLSPCPWCGVEEDRGHDLLKHVNPKLGTHIK